MAEESPKELKTLWEKEKLIVTSNFSFSESVFKRLVLQIGKNQGLFGKGLTLVQIESICRRQFNVTQNIKYVFLRVESTGCQHFLLFSQCFKRPLPQGCQKS